MATFDALEYAEVEVAPVPAAQMPGESASDPATIASAMHATFDKLGAFLQEHALAPAGPPRAIYTSYGPEGIKFIVAIPIAAPPAAPIAAGPGSVATLPGGTAMRFTHRGPYAGLMQTYGQITEFLKAKGLRKPRQTGPNTCPCGRSTSTTPTPPPKPTS